MKVILKQSATSNSEPFSTYNHDEAQSLKSNYVPLRNIAQQRTDQWLKELQAIHTQFSNALCKQSQYWWFSALSRLDARPWGHEHLIKPLFFARAILTWFHDNPQHQQLTVHGAPPELALYLKNMERSVHIVNFDTTRHLWTRQLLSLLQIAWFTTNLAKLTSCALYRCLRLKAKLPQGQTLILFERFDPKLSAVDCRNYFYHCLFETCEHQKQIVFGCIDQLVWRKQYDDQATQNTCNILDEVNFFDVLASLCQQLWLTCCVFAQALNTSNLFWKIFVFSQLRQSTVFREICLSRVMNRAFGNGVWRTVVYPYEEKGYERAILHGLKGTAARVIGYIPHPQHRLAVSMRESGQHGLLRPSLYAACGTQYVEFFAHWAHKQEQVHVWGTDKSPTAPINPRKFDIPLKILVLLSHPNELDVFTSWLMANPHLLINRHFCIRGYPNAGARSFDRVLSTLLHHFPQISTASRGLNEELHSCDIAVFNATSAGLLASTLGKLAIHIGLDDFFAINPCFDQLESMLSCKTANDFEARLTIVTQTSPEGIATLLQQQRAFIQTILSPINRLVIDKDLA